MLNSKTPIEFTHLGITRATVLCLFEAAIVKA